MNELADRLNEQLRNLKYEIVSLRDGRIARLDEYLDSAHLKPLQTA